MATINFGGVAEQVVTREEFPLEQALETLKNETIAVIGYGVQGPGQSLNLRDNGLLVSAKVGKAGKKHWKTAGFREKPCLTSPRQVNKLR
jgi:ketol-acid reductoisomerase